ncbi:hypothetical protein NFI96_027618, partial [Prochilodus magdalenae]
PKLPPPENQTLEEPPVQEEVCHIYNEISAVYSVVGLADTENSSGIYTVIQHAYPTVEDCPTYSLVAPH